MCLPAASNSGATDVLPGDVECLQEIHQGSCMSSKAPDRCPMLGRGQSGQGGVVPADAAGFRG